MTDKQIIIDGVDVSRCIYYKTGDCLISPVWCDQFYNCYYKHLQRTESRNKELEDVEAFRLEELATLDDLREENNKLKQTLADIKEMAERDKEFCIQCNGDKEIDCIGCIEGGRALLAKDIIQKIREV